MKIKKTQKRTVTTLLIIILLVIACSVGYLLLLNNNPSNNSSHISDQPNKTTSATDTSNNNGDTSVNKTTQPSNRETEKNLPLTENTENISQSDNLSVTISHKSVQDNKLVLRVTIQQLISSGECTLTLTKDSNVITKKANIVQNPSSSTCAGFDIPVNELGSGLWNINIAVTGNNKTDSVGDKININ